MCNMYIEYIVGISSRCRLQIPQKKVVLWMLWGSSVLGTRSDQEGDHSFFIGHRHRHIPEQKRSELCRLSIPVEGSRPSHTRIWKSDSGTNCETQLAEKTPDFLFQHRHCGKTQRCCVCAGRIVLSPCLRQRYGVYIPVLSGGLR